jgi:cytochrome c-type biogenesis protein CcmF
MIVFVGASAFAFWTNGIVVYQNWKKGWHLTGAPLSHIGVGMIMIAIIVSGTFDKSERVVLEKDNPKEALGFQLTYKGLDKKPDGKDVVNIEVNSEKKSFLAQPRLFYSQKNRGMMREPDVDPGILEDLYISPLERQVSEPKNAGHQLILKKEEATSIAGYTVTFLEYDMTSHASAPGSFSIGAKLEITKENKTTTITPRLLMSGQKREFEPVEINLASDTQNKNPTIALAAINADEKSVLLLMNGIPGHDHGPAEPSDQLIVEISTKPFMNVLWSGTVILLFGTFISLQRRIFK